MFRHLVVPLDGSEFAARALPIAKDLAAAAGASVRVIGIARSDAELPWTYDHVVSDAQRSGVDEGDVVVRVDPDPTAMLVETGSADDNVLCLASHLRTQPAATLMHAVGSRAIERISRPVVLVGPAASTASDGSEVVVALDGVSDPQPLLDSGAAWARQLGSVLRLVTVYEPVIAEPGDPNLFVRKWGTSYDPHAYLDAVSGRVDKAGLAGLEAIAIRDLDGPAHGLEQHLAGSPGRLVVVGADRAPSQVVRQLLETARSPLLVVNGKG
jgi:hypothetical protein